MRTALAVAAAALAVALGGCASEATRGERVFLGHCAPCHGDDGDGRGPAAKGMSPPPRDLRPGIFKFAGVDGRGLPDDVALERIVRGGLAGTAMRGWDLPPTDLAAVVAHLKTLSPPGVGWRDPTLAVQARPPAVDPVPPAERAAAIAAGERLYHVDFQCTGCHPSYAAADRLVAWGVAARPDAGRPLARWSSTFGVVLLAGDFLRHPPRAVADRDPGPGLDLDPADLHRAIAYGLAGPMPGYGHLGDRAVWQVAHYVKSLADRRRVGPPGPPP